MTSDTTLTDHAVAVAVLLHPHPDFGGTRFHPFIDGLYRSLPESHVAAVRFDFTTGDPAAARQDTLTAIDGATGRFGDIPILLAGYSFGAATASMIDDSRVSAWFLLAPPASLLEGAPIGDRPGPKALYVPERDQFSSVDEVRRVTADWSDTSVTVLPGVDHFLGPVEHVIRMAVDWLVAIPGIA